MKPFFVSLWSMGVIAFLSTQHIETYVNILVQSVVGILTMIYLVKKIRSIKS